jgi:hypothetical protein
MTNRIPSLGTVLLAVVAGGCSKPTSEAPKPSGALVATMPSGSSPAATTPQGVPAKKAQEVTAEAWGQEALKAANQDAFNKKSAGERIQVRGKVRNVQGDAIYLETGAKGGDFLTGVSIALTMSDPAAALTVKPGDEVVIEGDFVRLDVFGPACKQCIIIRKS